MTKKLINGILLIMLSIVLIPYYYDGLICAKNNRLDGSIHSIISALVFSLVSLVIFMALIFHMIQYFEGKYDKFFQKYTDPKLQQFCNWINRRNKTEC